MAGELRGKRVAVLVANEGVEQVELTAPWEAIEAAGGEAVLIAPEKGDVAAFNHLDPADTFQSQQSSADTLVEDFDGLVLPGGVANPDQLRTDAASVALVKDFVESGRPVAVICHGPWTLVEADTLTGRTITSWPSLRTDITNAGGRWVDRAVSTCTAGPNTIVSSRNPGDLPAFCDEFVRVMA